MRILIALLLITTPALAQAPAQGPPPKNLTRHADGRFSANSDPSNPERFEIHTVMKGETLSGIAGEVLKNPRLWPQLWEQNEHIVNPHWIYPDDKILIKPITQITEAAPPPPPAPEPTPEPPPPPAPPAARPPLVAVIQPAPRPPAQDVFTAPPPPVAPEVKATDIYCSGFIRTQPVAADLKVLSRYNAEGGALATEADYIYISRGADGGVKVGDMYQIVRPTKNLDSPRRSGERNRGRHYLDVAQIRVVIAQPAFSVARVLHSCEAAEIGDIMIPFQRVTLPAIPKPRTFSPFMTASGQAQGFVISTKDALQNFGSTFKGSGATPGVRSGDLAALEHGFAPEGAIAYVDLGAADGVKPGDVLIAFRNVEMDSQLYKLPKEADVLKTARTAVGEMIILKVEERASTALVTYAVGGIARGDAVERR
jgi:hypothetical protein